MTESLHWLDHAAFRWDGRKTIYFDPWNLAKAPKKADIILISHEHFDHFSKPDITNISTKDTIILTCEEVARQLKADEVGCKEVKVLSPGESVTIDGVKVKAVSSYNIGKAFHQKNSGKTGFIVTMDGESVYHAGDTDAIPEMKDYRCDVALLPVGGTYTMTADEAAQAAVTIGPKVAIPMHYGDTAGHPEAGRRFAELLKGKINVLVPKKEK